MGERVREQPGNLPEEVTSFVGRRRELAGARQRMTESRLVTLVGAGGVGKTRLALQVAADARRAFADGVWMVDLSSLRDPSRLAQTVLSALEVRDQSARRADVQLADHLRDRRLLVVLDNCEHLLEACAGLVASLLRRAPGLQVLATSREALGIGGEHLFTVPPLSTPDPDAAAEPDGLLRYEAVSLLVDRARAVRSDFAVSADNQDAVARLCSRLDGMPLAIELAATRLRSLSVGEVLERLDDRFRLLTGGSRSAVPRQQTLRALIDWSHDLCLQEEQLLWARLSVFAGSFDLGAVEGVCAGDGLRREAIVDIIDHLVAKSILQVERAGTRARYRMLATVREYGAERLAAAGEEEPLRRRHRDHYLQQARAMAAAWAGPGQAAGLARMREDHPNLRSALEFSIQRPGEADAAAALVGSLRYQWVVGGFLSEGRRWLDQALAMTAEPTLARGEALWVAAWVTLLQGDAEAAARRLAECDAIAAALQDPSLAAHASGWHGLDAMFSGAMDRGIDCYERSVRGHERLADLGAKLTMLFQLGVTLSYAGELARARAVCEEAVALGEPVGERWVRAYALWATGMVEWQEGDLEAGRRATEEALDIQRDFQDGIAVALMIELLAWIAAAQSRPQDAARLLGAARAVWTQIGTSIEAFPPQMKADSDACERRTADELGPPRFAALVEGQAALPIDAAIAVALGSAAAPGPAPADSPLSRREAEVAALIADGLSNRAIAESLVLSKRTVDGHVERILAKLGFGSRAQVAAWVADRAASGVA
jgi:predicted ATPase/DNA-binding CsgD family transcriptional regulator